MFCRDIMSPRKCSTVATSWGRSPNSRVQLPCRWSTRKTGAVSAEQLKKAVERRWCSCRMPRTHPDSRTTDVATRPGTFRFDVPPGHYTIATFTEAAFQDAQFARFGNPGFLSRLESRGERVKVDAGA